MKRMFFCALLSTTIWAGVLENNYTKEEFEKIDNRSGEEIAKDYVNETLKNLPERLDNSTTLTNTIAINTKIYFKINIDEKKDKKIKELLSTEIGKEIYIKTRYKNRRNELCNDKLLRANIDYKSIGIQDDYYESKTQKYIGGFSIDKSDCIELDKQQKKRG